MLFSSVYGFFEGGGYVFDIDVQITKFNYTDTCVCSSLISLPDNSIYSTLGRLHISLTINVCDMLCICELRCNDISRLETKSNIFKIIPVEDTIDSTVFFQLRHLKSLIVTIIVIDGHCF